MSILYMAKINFTHLLDYLRRVPGIDDVITTGVYEDKNWWIKFSIDIENKLAWNVIQELGHVINYISLNERLPAIFYPVSAPPYLNGGPHDYLYWVIESKQTDFKPGELKKWLEGRLPKPVDNIEEWNYDES